MSTFDGLVNNVISPTSTYAGVSAVFLSFFSNKLAPRMPEKFYKLLDNDLVRIVIVSFLLNQQLKKPSMSVLLSIAMVLGYDLLVKFLAPDAPPLSELVKSTTQPEKKEGGASNGACNCYCGHTINVPPPPPGSIIKNVKDADKPLDPKSVDSVNTHNATVNIQNASRIPLSHSEGPSPYASFSI